MLLFFNYLFIYSFIYLFLVALGLHSVLRLSLVVASKGYSLLWCMGFSFQWLILLQNTGSRCKLLYLQHMNSVVNSCELQGMRTSVTAACMISSYCLWARECVGFSSCGPWAQSLSLTGSRVWLSSCGIRALSLRSMWDFLRPGIRAMSPHWQMESYPWYHHLSSRMLLFQFSNLILYS